MPNRKKEYEGRPKQRADSKVHNSIWIPTLANCEERKRDMLRYAGFPISADFQELMISSNHVLEALHVVVDERSETVHPLPLTWLVRTSNLFATWYTGCREGKYTSEGNMLYLKRIRSDVFCDFARWLFQNEIAVPWCVDTQYIVEANARRLIAALDLGIFLDCAEYQLAAMREFLALAPYMEWPEDYVNSIWSVTTNWRDSQNFDHLDNFEKARLTHPMRHMIVAIVAAKTVGKEKRSVRIGPRDAGVNRGDQIPGHVFWLEYNEYVKQNAKGRDCECSMPERVEWFL